MYADYNLYALQDREIRERELAERMAERRRQALERVMNLNENRIGIRILRLARSLAVPRFPHSQAIPDRVHNSL